MKKRILLFTNFVLLTLLISCIVSGCDEYENQVANNNYQNIENNKAQVNNQDDKDNTTEIQGNNTEDNNTGNGLISDEFDTNNLKGNKEGDMGNKNNVKTEDDLDKDSESNLFIEIYYQDIEGFVIPVTRRIPKQLSVAKSAVNGLINTPLNRESMSYYGLIPIIPMGTEFTINLKENTAIIDFNDKVLDYNSKKAEHNIVTSIVYTLTQFDSIDRVKILINGYEKSMLKYGTDISKILSREDVLINPLKLERINLQNEMKKIDVYLLKSVRGTQSDESKEVFLIPVSLEINDMGRNEMVSYIMNYLSTYEDETKLYSAVDQAIKLIDSKIDNDLLTLDLSVDIGKYGGTFDEHLLINQILYSMKQFNGVNKINFLIDGKAIGFPEGSDISTPVTFPMFINDIVDEGYD